MTTAAQVIDAQGDLRARLQHAGHPWAELVRDLSAYFYENESGWAREAFYPFHDVTTGNPEEPPGWPAALAQRLSRDLFDALTFQVTADMCEVAENITAETARRAVHAEPGDLPCERGFIWLDKPYQRRDDAGELMQVQVITWGPQQVTYPDGDWAGVRLTLWMNWDDPDPEVQAVTGRRPGEPGEDRMDELRAELGPLMPGLTMVLPFGQRHGELPAGANPAGEAPVHYALTLWLMLGSEITVSAVPQLDRGTRRRALRSLKQNDVRVITLRRTRAGPGDGPGHRDVDWSCRWMVRGFWRHLEDYSPVAGRHEARSGDGRFCDACAARVTWVRPHVRGPEDKPLHAREIVHRLSR